MTKLVLTLLGGFEVRTVNSEPLELPNRKERALLVWLALNGGRRLGRETAAALLWGDRARKQAQASLSQALYSIRKSLAQLGCEAVSADGETIALESERTSVDALTFSALIGKGDRGSLMQAAELYRGPLLDGFPSPTPEFEEWLESERRLLEGIATDLFSDLLEVGGRTAESCEYAEIARRLRAIDPYSEDAARALMLHHAMKGRISAAAAEFETLRGRLETELGTHPSDETLELHARILERQIVPNRTAIRRHGAHEMRTGLSASLVAVSVAVALAVLVGAASWWLRSEVSSADVVLPAKPSIAVLAFDDLSNGADRGYLDDAIAEAIITNLSHFSELFVSARNSSFHYRDETTDVREIARELGVRYVLVGSQQKAGDRLRVTVQLVDTVGGNHLWARTYDGDMSEIFLVQDRISTSVAASLGEKLRSIVGEAASRADPNDLEAFEHVLAAARSLHEITPEGTERARLSYEAALVADPDLASAHAGLAWVHINGYRWGWTDLDRKAALARAREEAETAVRLAPNSYDSHFALAHVLMQAGERDRAVAEFEKTLELNPNDGNVMATYAEQLGYLGRFREAADWLRKAMRLDPHHPEWFHWNLAWALYSSGDCEAALTAIYRMSSPPAFANRTLAAILVCLGRRDDARAAVDSLLEYDPSYSIAKFRLNFAGKYQDPVDFENWVDDLRVAGLPE